MLRLYWWRWCRKQWTSKRTTCLMPHPSPIPRHLCIHWPSLKSQWLPSSPCSPLLPPAKPPIHPPEFPTPTHYLLPAHTHTLTRTHPPSFTPPHDLLDCVQALGVQSILVASLSLLCRAIMRTTVEAATVARLQRLGWVCMRVWFLHCLMPGCGAEGGCSRALNHPYHPCPIRVGGDLVQLRACSTCSSGPRLAGSRVVRAPDCFKNDTGTY